MSAKKNKIDTNLLYAIKCDGNKYREVNSAVK